MSDIPQFADRSQRLANQIAGRWQIPLLVVSSAALLAGIWHALPEAGAPAFEEEYANALSLFDAGFYPEASNFAEQMLTDPKRLPEESRRLHALLARIIFEHERGNVVHGSGNAQRLLEHSRLSAGSVESLDARTHYMRALACEWLHRPSEALEAYNQTLAKGIDDVWPIRKRILEIQNSIGGVTVERLHAAYDEFIAGDDVSDELRYWAAEQKVELFGREDRQEDAGRFLAHHADRFRASAFGGRYEYLQALSWFHLGQLDDAERAARALRDRLSPADDIYTSAGWLLGKVLQATDAPEFALSFYDDVIDKAMPGPHRASSLLGRAEVLASLERFDESLEAYDRVVLSAEEDPYGALVNLRDVRESARQAYETQRQKHRLPEAMAYLRIASKLVPPADVEKQALYCQWRAELARMLGQTAMEASRRNADPESQVREAKRNLVAAGDEYLQLADLVSLDEAASSDAVWHAADAFDEAGERQRAAEVLDAFVSERPTSNLVSKALFRLGQTYQALGEYEKAIARYQENLVRFGGMLSASASVVPLADCFTELNELDKAESALLRLVSYQPGESLRSVTPEAPEYADAVFRLGDIYIQQGEFEKAIARCEEGLQRYPDDPRADRTCFMLAEAYRQSALAAYEESRDPDKVAYKDDLRAKFEQRTKHARDLYGEVIDRYRVRAPEDMSALDQLYRKLSYFHRADAVYDLSLAAVPTDDRPYAESLELYDRAAWVYQRDPMAMTAYIQMINCHLQLGGIEKARMTLQRAKWALKGIPEEAFAQYAPDEDQDYWQEYLAWLESTPTFAIPEASEG